MDVYKNAEVWKEFLNIEEIKSGQFDETEWNTLVGIREDLANRGWTEPWDMSLGIDGVYSFKELTVENGHVVKMNLSGCNITGDFPWDVFKLPYLEELDLSGNNLSGDIGAGMQTAVAANPNAGANLKTVNISNNKFSGNIALFANSCPALQSLDASVNCISDVVPAISPNVTTLDLSSQAIDKTVDLDLANLRPEALLPSVPTVLLYDHEAQTYNTGLRFLCTPAELSDFDMNSGDDWGVVINYANGQLTVPEVSKQNAYYGENGGVLNVMMLNSNGTEEGSTLKMRLKFAMGDANFSGGVDVTDLQTIILRIFDNYSTMPFNYTAANTVKDETLNVQDVVGEVNLLLAAAGTDAASASMAKASASAAAGTTAADAAVYCRGGELKIYSSVPVAAFDIVVDKASSLSVGDRLSALGLTYAVKETAGGTHIIGYSLSGGSVPAGETAIGTLRGSGCRVSAAVLSDGQANKIPAALNGGATAIGGVSDGQPGVELVDGRLVVNTNGADGGVDWAVTALDGSLLGKGTVSGHSGSSVIDLNVRGAVIVALKSADGMIVTKKVIVDKN